METFRQRFRAATDKEAVDTHPHELSHPELRPPTLREQIQSAIRSELSIRAQDRGLESFEQADDFEDPDDSPDPLTIYEQALLVPENEETLDGAEPLPAPAGAEPTPGDDTPPPPAGSPEPAEEVVPPAEPLAEA